MTPFAVCAITLACAAILLAVIVVSYCLWASRAYFTRKDSPPRKKESAFARYRSAAASAAESLPHEKLAISSFDGLKLSARLYAPAGEGGETVVCVHGYRGNGLRDMGYAVNFLVSAGYNVLLVDDRAHGESEGRVIGFGALDRRDIMLWLGELDRRLHPRAAYLMGVSMGASTVLMTADLGLPPWVKGIVADCGYTSSYEEMKHLFRSKGAPAFLLAPLIRAFCKGYVGYDIKTADCRKSLASASVPVLFIHGKNDDFVPPRMSEENRAATKSETRIEFFDSRHASSHYSDPARYEAAVLGFLRDCRG